MVKTRQSADISIFIMSGKMKVLVQLGFFSWKFLGSDYMHRNSTFWPVWYSACL